MFKISVIGCGFVGLCLAVVAATRGVKVIAVDIDEQKINKIKSGQPTFYEPGLSELLKQALLENLVVTNDINLAVMQSDITFITVGTPQNVDGSANLSFLESAITDVARVLKDKKERHMVVIKSTVTPTTTSNIIRPILENESGKKVGSSIGLIMNPEFLREGSAVYDTENPHLIVIGKYDENSANNLESFYKYLHGKTVPEIIRTTTVTAELIKYANNSFLATKISFINTIANICQNIPNTDVKTIAYAIGKDPRIGSLFLQAGPGYGGSCFPKDVSALINFSRRIGYDPLLISATQKVNELQSIKVLELIERELDSIENKKITILGLAFKKDTDDIRESTSIKLIDHLLKKGANVSAHDPMAIENSRKVLGTRINFYQDITSSLKDADCCVTMTDWDEYKNLKKEIFGNMKQKIIIDARRILSISESDDIRLVSIGTN